MQSLSTTHFRPCGRPCDWGRRRQTGDQGPVPFEITKRGVLPKAKAAKGIHEDVPPESSQQPPSEARSTCRWPLWKAAQHAWPCRRDSAWQAGSFPGGGRAGSQHSSPCLCSALHFCRAVCVLYCRKRTAQSVERVSREIPRSSFTGSQMQPPWIDQTANMNLITKSQKPNGRNDVPYAPPPPPWPCFVIACSLSYHACRTTKLVAKYRNVHFQFCKTQ